ncbi:hypothetical protein BGZ46_009558 [Entomortierella lignicola]|nr:hypothetical protein BGZ46_009558 [Entomortierella lignicola]
MASTNITVNPATPWTKYFCNKDTPCPVANTTCHYDKYCIPILGPGETCKDDKDIVDPFVARIDNVYTYFCDMPTEIKEQTTKCPLGCEVWEDCHSNVCFVKKCTKDQSACKAGDFNMCNGLKQSEVFCYETTSHGNTLPQTVEKTGLSSSQVGGIAGGVSVAVIILAAAGAFFLIRRRRRAAAQLAAKTQGSNQSLPTYSAQDEKNAMKQVTVSA